MNQEPSRDQIDSLIKSGLKEDIGSGDITTRSILTEDQIYEAKVLARDNLILSGLNIFKAVFSYLDPEVSFSDAPFADGDAVSDGASIIKLKGRGIALLEGERVALNILQRLCGIASLTRDFVERANPIEIWDTRKTTPGLRVFEKYAVLCGGGKNHRFGLYDAVLIKDNHIKAAGGILPAVEKVRSQYGSQTSIEVETTNHAEVNQALDAKSDIIMLDNMSLEDICEAVRIIDGRARIEVSGTVTLDRLESLSSTGIDYVSVGALTHSARASDISMNFASLPS
jgi:nicotinate-nucleotide pyrophosphorylase (carboxylating)